MTTSDRVALDPNLRAPGAEPTSPALSSTVHLARSLEERSLNAWPGLQQCLYDGWFLRFSGGYTKRANSVIPFYAGLEAPDRKIRYCEAAYARRQLPAIFKILPFGDSGQLDEQLGSLGYEAQDETSTQAMELVGGGPEIGSTPAWVRVISGVDLEYLRGYAGLNGVAPWQLTHLQAILKQCPGDIACVAATEGRGLVGCGLGILEGENLGLFGIATAAAHRNRGIGTGVVTSLLAWGRTGGARVAYLQVLARNATACSLYRKLGFQEMYRYWYRVPEWAQA